MVFLAFFIVLVLIAVIFTRLWISFMVLLAIDDQGFHLEAKAMFYKLLTLYKWDHKEGGFSFLLKKKEQVPDEMKKKKGRLAAVFEMLFSKDTFRHLKERLEIFDVSVTGRLSARDAATTALLYGGVWGVLGILTPFIPQKRMILDFYPDFTKEIPDFHVTCILRVRIIHIIVLIIQNKRKKMREGRSESYGTASY